SGWDKALYYLTHSDVEYEFAWIAEDDVYFKSPAALISILSEYEGSKSDLICTHFRSPRENPDWPHWSTSESFFQPEHVRAGFVPFCRLSKTLLQAVELFANTQRQLTFIEVLFASLCRSNNLTAQKFGGKLRMMYRPILSRKDADE